MTFHVVHPLQNRQKQSKLMILYATFFTKQSNTIKSNKQSQVADFQKTENHSNFMFFSPKTIFDACKVFSFPNMSFHNRFRFQIQSSAYASRHHLPILGRRSINFDILFLEGSHVYFIRSIARIHPKPNAKLDQNSCAVEACGNQALQESLGKKNGSHIPRLYLR